MNVLASAVYLLCSLTSLFALLLVYRSWRRQPERRLLMWSSLAFVAIAANNVFLFIDVVLLPQTDLLTLRQATSAVALACLLYGFIWQAE